MSTIFHKKHITKPRALELAAYFLAVRIARGKFSQLKEQAKENLVFGANKTNNTPFQNSEKALTPVNSTQALADELKTSTDTASRIIQIQAKAMKAKDGIRL